MIQKPYDQEKQNKQKNPKHFSYHKEKPESFKLETIFKWPYIPLCC